MATSSKQQQAKPTPSAQQTKVASLSMTELQAHLGVTLDGLSSAEALKRQAHDGYNELAEKHAHPLLRLLSSFWGPIPWMIEVAAILSVVVHHWADVGIILASGPASPRQARWCMGHHPYA